MKDRAPSAVPFLLRLKGLWSRARMVFAGVDVDWRSLKSLRRGQSSITGQVSECATFRLTEQTLNPISTAQNISTLFAQMSMTGGPLEQVQQLRAPTSVTSRSNADASGLRSQGVNGPPAPSRSE